MSHLLAQWLGFLVKASIIAFHPSQQRPGSALEVYPQDVAGRHDDARVPQRASSLSTVTNTLGLAILNSTGAFAMSCRPGARSGTPHRRRRRRSVAFQACRELGVALRLEDLFLLTLIFFNS